jgi:hypothetical protein
MPLCAHLIRLPPSFDSVMYSKPGSAMKGSCEMRQQVGASKLFSSSRTEQREREKRKRSEKRKVISKSSLNATDVNIIGVMRTTCHRQRHIFTANLFTRVISRKTSQEMIGFIEKKIYKINLGHFFLDEFHLDAFACAPTCLVLKVFDLSTSVFTLYVGVII